jgi:hypothetical protein
MERSYIKRYKHKFAHTSRGRRLGSSVRILWNKYILIKSEDKN